MSRSQQATATSPAELAGLAYDLVQTDPRRAQTLAERALLAAREAGDVAAELDSLHTLGWARHVNGDLRAVATLRQGIRLARRSAADKAAGILRRQLALVLADDGRTREASREIEAALALLGGVDRARSQVHRLGVYGRMQSVDRDRYRELCSDAGRALALLRRRGDEMWVARLEFNRALLRLNRGEVTAAERDLRDAGQICRRLAASAAAVDVEIALAWGAIIRGDVLDGLRRLDEVETTAPGEPRPRFVPYYRAVALTQARLLPEARDEARTAIELNRRAGFGDYATLGMLDLARIHLMSGRCDEARELAVAAGRAQAARGNRPMSASARLLVVRCETAAGASTRRTVRRAVDAAGTLDAAGWTWEARRGRLVAAQAALAAGMGRSAAGQLELASPLARGGTAADKIEHAYVSALVDTACGRVDAAERSLLRGLRLGERHRASLGAFELRASASGLVRQLAAHGVELAVRRGDAESILDWVERLRGNALRLPPLSPPPDRRLEMLQAELRLVLGSARRDAAGGGLRETLARQRRLEAAIRSRTRSVRGPALAEARIPRRCAGLAGSATVVEFVEHGAGLGAIVVRGGRAAYRAVAGDPATEIEWLRMSLAAHARKGQDGRSAPDAFAAAARLEAQLLGPVGLLGPGADRLVVVPSGHLHAIPWAMFPGLRGTPVTLAPSLTTWAALSSRPAVRTGKVVVASGPGLRHSTGEARQVGSLFPASAVLTGPSATAEAVLRAIDGAKIAHLACHGHFRADSPLFSSLELADGPLNVYELQRLRRAPEIVVLSACDLGLSAVHPGDELLGLAAALLGMGTRTIVASVLPVPDAAARRLMVDFHRRLAAGAGPAEALAQAQARAADPTVAGFVCLGCG